MVANARKVDPAEAVRLRLVELMPITKIAERFGVSRQCIHQHLIAHHADGLIGLRRECVVCGKVFVRKFRQGSLSHCSKKCRQKTRRESQKKQMYDRCRCGRTKCRKAETCRGCTWKYDLDIAREACESGAIPRQIAAYYGIESSGIYNGFRRHKIKVKGPGKGGRSALTDHEAFELIRTIEESRKSPGGQP
jgi:transposase-like protein